MNLEKLAHSKINRIADWIIRLVVLNVLMIATMLPIVTIFIALSSGYNQLSDYINGKNPPLIKGYFEHFKSHFKKKLVRGLTFTVFIVFLFSNIRFYLIQLETEHSLIYLIGYYVSIILLVLLLTVMLYSLAVTKIYPKINIKLFYKLSFFLAGKYFLNTIALVFIILIPFAMLMMPFTTMVFVFIGISLPIILNAIFTRSAVRYMESLGEENV